MTGWHSLILLVMEKLWMFTQKPYLPLLYLSDLLCKHFFPFSTREMQSISKNHRCSDVGTLGEPMKRLTYVLPSGGSDPKNRENAFPPTQISVVDVGAKCN